MENKLNLQAEKLPTAAVKPNYLIKSAPIAAAAYPKSQSVPHTPKSPQRPAPLQAFHPTPSTNFNNNNLYNNTTLSPSPQPIQQQKPLSAGVVSKPLSPLAHLNTYQPPFNNSYSPSIASTATYSAKSPLGWAHVNSPKSPSHLQNKYYQTNYQISPPFELTSTSEQTSGTHFGQQQVRSRVSHMKNLIGRWLRIGSCGDLGARLQPHTVRREKT